MGRVDDHHRGARHFGDHLGGGDGHRALAALLFQVGIALGFLVFLTQLLVAHHLAAAMVVDLPQVVEPADDQHHHQHQQREFGHHPQHFRADQGRAVTQGRHDPVEMGSEEDPQDAGIERQFHGAFREFDEA